MTDLKDLLDAVADRAAPIDDLADRAVSGAIRRRRRAIIAAPLMAAALAAAALLIPTQLEHRGLEPVRPSSTATVRPGNTIPEVDIRLEDQPALPDRLAERALLAYAVPCSRSASCTNPWRLLTADGKQWNIPTAAGNGRDTGAVSVAPNGERIAYLTKHPRNGSGYLVVRDLASGASDRPLEVPAGLIDGYRARLSWSPDSRWVGIDYRLPPQVDSAGGDPRATVVDTTTMDAERLSYPCCLAGLPNHSVGWFPLLPQVTGGLRADRTLKLNQSGEVAGELPAAIRRNVSSGPGEALVSPDGSVIATISRRDGATELAVVDTGAGTVSTRRDLGGLLETADATFELLRWTGAHTVLAVVGRGESSAGVYAIDVRDGTARLEYQLSRRPDRLSVGGKDPAGGTK